MHYLESWQWPRGKLQYGSLKISPSWKWWDKRFPSHLKQTSGFWFLKNIHTITVSVGYILVLNNTEIHGPREKLVNLANKREKILSSFLICFFVFVNQVTLKCFWPLHFMVPRSLQNRSSSQRTQFQLYEQSNKKTDLISRISSCRNVPGGRHCCLLLGSRHPVCAVWAVLLLHARFRVL